MCEVVVVGMVISTLGAMGATLPEVQDISYVASSSMYGLHQQVSTN